MDLLNPKMGAFYVALLPQFIPPGSEPAGMGTLLGLVHAAETLAWFGLLVLAVHRMRTWLARPTTRRWIDGVSGAAIVGFGLRLGLARH